jgi:tetratricopeptide (TPR) repeat protein
MTDLLEKPLYGVAIYNPRLLSKDELVRFFVARQAELGRLVDALRREAEAQPQHHLIVGARGMGKTTLLHRLRYAIADDEYLASRCLGLVFPEEQYNVGCLADFWLNCVDALADELESMQRVDLVEGLDSEVARLQALAEPDDRGRRALELLCQLSDRLDRRLVLLVDNMDLVLDRLETEQWTLREVLSSEARIQVVGATSAPLESHYRHDKAFYDFFRVHHLTGLGDEETFTVLRRLAEVTEHDRVARLLDEEPARVKTVRLMAGGNPRTVVLLFSLLAQETEGDVRTDIERLLDLCTPLYKHRLEVLSMQAQQVLDALAMHWAPATAAAIAKATHLKVNVVSTHLDRLVKDGTVEKVTLPAIKRHGFQIAERFFNIWCLMRASRRVRRRLVWLVEFLRLMFGPEELTLRARRHLVQERLGDNVRHAEMGLAYASAIEDAPLRTALESQSIRALCIEPEVRRQLGDLLDLDGQDSGLLDRAERMRLLAEAREAVMTAAMQHPGWDPERFWEQLGGSLALSVQMKHQGATAMIVQPALRTTLDSILRDERAQRCDGFVEEEVEALSRAVREGYIDLQNLSRDELEGAALAQGKRFVVPCALGIASAGGFPVDLEWFTNEVQCSRSLITWISWARLALKGHISADEISLTLLPVIEAQQWGSRTLSLLGWLQVDLRQYDQAEASYRKAISLDPLLAFPWNDLGNLLQDHRGKYDEAEAAYRKAISLDSNYAYPWNGLGHLFHNRLARYDEAEAAYRKAISLDPQFAPPWSGLGYLLQYRLARYDEAEAAHRKAISLDSKFAFPWLGLGDLFQNGLARYDEAETAYRKAISLDSTLAFPWLGLGNLFQLRLARYDEAETAYRKAISLDSKFALPWLSLGNLFQYHFAKYAEAETAYRNAISLDPNLAFAWTGLASLLHLHLGRYDEAETAYRNAVSFDPSLASSWTGLGDLFQNHLKRYDEAEAAYRTAIALDHKVTFAWNGLGNLFQYHLKRYDEAEAAYRTAIALDPKITFAWNGLGNLLHWQLAKYDEAEAAYRTAIALDPKMAFAWNGLGNLLQWHLKRYDEAEAAYRTAISLDPNLATPWNGLGDLLQYCFARHREAEVSYRKAIALDPKLVYPWNGLGNLLQDHLAKYDEAEMAYRTAISLDPKLAWAWNGLGDLLQEYLARYDEAEIAYREAISLDPSLALAWNGLGNLLQDRLGRYDEAETAYRKAISLDSHLAWPWNSLGGLLQHHFGKYDEAVLAYRKATSLSPDWDLPWNNLAWLLYLQNQDLEEAADAARKATAAEDNPYPDHTLATILVARGDWVGAEPWARRFIRSGDDDFFMRAWFDILRFFAEAVRHGFVRETRGLLTSVGVAERWEPLDRALEVIENRSSDALGCLSPEMREAVLLVLAKISPDTIGDHT